MRSRSVFGVLLAAGMLPLAAMSAGAQGAPWQIGTGFGYEFYSFSAADRVGIENISLATVPFVAQASIGSAFFLTVSGAHATGSLTRSDGTKSSLSGLTDTAIQASLPVLQGSTSLVLTGVVTVPSGTPTLTREEAEVAGVMAADLLPFRITNWGSGTGTAGQVALARRYDAAGLGLSVSYRVAGEFEPLVDPAFGYQPGNELRLRFAADRTIGSRSKLAAHVTYQRYGDDQLEGQNLFQSGDRLQLVGSYAFPVGFESSGVTYAGVLHRTEGSAIGASQGQPPIAVTDAPAQTLFLLGTALRQPMGKMLLVPGADLRVFRREDGIGQGYVLGIGTSAEFRPFGGSRQGGMISADRGLVFIPSLRFRLGNLIAAEDAESRFTGADLGLSVRLGG